MSILSDIYLEELLSKGLIAEPDYSMVNPATIDIRVGLTARREMAFGHWEDIELPTDGIEVAPGEFLLLATYESFRVPNGYAMDLRLKSSTARRGWDHSLAFWVDPGWEGVLTMEVRNVLRFNSLRLVPGERFAQVIVHKLIGASNRLYAGRYLGAESVELAKD